MSINFEGEAPAVKEFQAVLTTGLSQIEVEAFPQDLPEGFTVNISGIENLGDAIYVKDIDIPENVDLLSNPEEMIVLASSTKLAEEEVEEVEEELEEEVSEPEVIEKGKKEEEDF